MMIKCEHPNIVRYYDLFDFYFELEKRMAIEAKKSKPHEGTLKEKMKTFYNEQTREAVVDFNVFQSWMQQILEGLRHMHHNPENVFIADGENPEEYYNIKIGDFGLATLKTQTRKDYAGTLATCSRDAAGTIPSRVMTSGTCSSPAPHPLPDFRPTVEELLSLQIFNLKPIPIQVQLVRLSQTLKWQDSSDTTTDGGSTLSGEPPKQVAHVARPTSRSRAVEYSGDPQQILSRGRLPSSGERPDSLQQQMRILPGVGFEFQLDCFIDEDLDTVVNSFADFAEGAAGDYGATFDGERSGSFRGPSQGLRDRRLAHCRLWPAGASLCGPKAKRPATLKRREHGLQLPRCGGRVEASGSKQQGGLRLDCQRQPSPKPPPIAPASAFPRIIILRGDFRTQTGFCSTSLEAAASASACALTAAPQSTSQQTSQMPLRPCRCLEIYLPLVPAAQPQVTDTPFVPAHALLLPLPPQPRQSTSRHITPPLLPLMGVEGPPQLPPTSSATSSSSSCSSSASRLFSARRRRRTPPLLQPPPRAFRHSAAVRQHQRTSFRQLLAQKSAATAQAGSASRGGGGGSVGVVQSGESPDIFP
uniref:Protein kinase domain-containing protein n=1 Tax=Macrostomum lignano TaxID=282301 RepID=A0A1I8FBA9_9PLAT